MGKLLIRFFTTIFILILIAIVICLALLFYTQYNPSEAEHVHLRNPQQATLITNYNYTLTTMNIGAGMMDAANKQDINYANHTEARTASQISHNFTAILSMLSELNSDFFTLQEVDQAASRSHFINQSKLFATKFANHSAAFTYTYNSPFMPLPLDAPLKQFESGLLTLSRYSTHIEQRLALPRVTDMISQFYTPHYALLETELPVRGNKKLIIANLHLANHDTASNVAEQQFDYLENYIKSFNIEQHYLILSGDWNHVITSPTFRASEPWPAYIRSIPESFSYDGMSWAYSKNRPTSRSTLASYEKDMSFVSITDGFLLSQNIEVISTVASETQFLYSHHAPVTLTFKLK